MNIRVRLAPATHSLAALRDVQDHQVRRVLWPAGAVAGILTGLCQEPPDNPRPGPPLTCASPGADPVRAPAGRPTQAPRRDRMMSTAGTDSPADTTELAQHRPSRHGQGCQRLSPPLPQHRASRRIDDRPGRPCVGRGAATKRTTAKPEALRASRPGSGPVPRRLPPLFSEPDPPRSAQEAIKTPVTHRDDRDCQRRKIAA
jgi:hypothetical protein